MAVLVSRSSSKNNSLAIHQNHTKVALIARLVLAAVGAILLILGSSNLMGSFSYHAIGAGVAFKIATIIWQSIASYQKKVERENALSIEQARFHKAISEVDDATIDIIIGNKKSKCDLNLAFRYAVSINQFEIADKLLKTHKVDRNAKNSEGLTALQFAILHKRTMQWKYLLSIDVDVNTHNTGKEDSPIYLALVTKNLDLIIELCHRHVNESFFLNNTLTSATHFSKDLSGDGAEEIREYFKKRAKARKTLGRFAKYIKQKPEKTLGIKPPQVTLSFH